jgi:hypothetical protein
MQSPQRRAEDSLVDEPGQHALGAGGSRTRGRAQKHRGGADDRDQRESAEDAGARQPECHARQRRAHPGAAERVRHERHEQECEGGGDDHAKGADETRDAPKIPDARLREIDGDLTQHIDAAEGRKREADPGAKRGDRGDGREPDRARRRGRQ